MAENFRHIVRVLSTDINGNRPVLYALSQVKGIGVMTASAACRVAHVNGGARIGTLSEEEIKRLEDIMKNPQQHNLPLWLNNRLKDPETGKNMHIVGNDLIFNTDMDIKKMKKIKSYKGIRHILGQPVRGQRTRSNFRKNKGKVQGVMRSRVTAPAKTDEKKDKKDKK